MTFGVASSARARAAERREKAWELRKQGQSFGAIGEALGYSKSQAERDIKHVFKELTERTLESAAEARVLDLARLDDLLLAWFPNAAGEGVDREEHPNQMGDIALYRHAAEIVLKILEQRAKLHGLYRQDVALFTPVPLAVASADLSGLNEVELDAVIRNLQAALGAGAD